MVTRENDRSVSEILHDIVFNVQEIVRSEIRLAKAEMREQAGKASRGVAMLGAGALAGILAVALLLTTCVLALATLAPAWLAALIIAFVTGIIAAVLIVVGRTQLKQVNTVPRRTIDTVKENLEWAKERTR